MSRAAACMNFWRRICVDGISRSPGSYETHWLIARGWRSYNSTRLLSPSSLLFDIIWWRYERLVIRTLIDDHVCAPCSLRRSLRR